MISLIGANEVGIKSKSERAFSGDEESSTKTPITLMKVMNEPLTDVYACKGPNRVLYTRSLGVASSGKARGGISRRNRHCVT